MFGPVEKLRRSPIDITGEREGRGREGGREGGEREEFVSGLELSNSVEMSRGGQGDEVAEVRWETV